MCPTCLHKSLSSNICKREHIGIIPDGAEVLFQNDPTNKTKLHSANSNTSHLYNIFLKSCLIRFKACFPVGHTASLDRAHQHESEEKCWSHDRARHDFFINYRVDAEGKQRGPSVCRYRKIAILIITISHAYNIQEPEKGVAQLVYEKLAVERGNDSLPVFVFWDQQCLNYGQNWLVGFVNGLENSTVIVLLISPTVCSSHYKQYHGREPNITSCRY